MRSDFNRFLSMKITLTKKFHFSASHSAHDRAIGHNYVLNVTTEALDDALEAILEKKVREVLIQKIDSRDLGLHVDFLKNIDVSDANLLKAFWEVIQPAIHPVQLTALSLEKDERTQVLFSRDS